MAFTYTDPTANMRDMVRLLVKDNVTGQMILTDQDLAAAAAAHPDATLTNNERFLVAYDAAISLYGHWLRIASAQVGPLRIEGTRRAEAALAQARLLYNRGHGLPPDASAANFVLSLVAGAMTLDSIDRPDPFFTRTTPP